MRELGPVAKRNKEMISDKINEIIKNGKSISDIRNQNPSLDEFCFNNNVKPIMYNFSSKFTNQHYLDLLNELEKEHNNKKEADKTEQVVIGNNVFVTNNEKTLVGTTELPTNKTNEHDIFEEQQRIKQEATMKHISDINLPNTTADEINKLSAINYYAKENNELANTEVFIDNGNISSIFKDSQGFHNINENNDEIISTNPPTNTNTNTNTKAKVKVKTKPGSPKISGAFANTLILSFIIGSFFGIIFLAIYIKVMH